MPIPNRAPNGSLYCVHGTFPDHCEACTGEYVASIERQLQTECARVKVLREALEKIVDHTAGDSDFAVYEVSSTAVDALAATAPEGES